jgi:hypothetical protein
LRTTEEGWLDELYHDPLRKNPPFPAQVVQALELELVELEQVFVKLGRMLWKGELDQVRYGCRSPWLKDVSAEQSCSGSGVLGRVEACMLQPDREHRPRLSLLGSGLRVRSCRVSPAPPWVLATPCRGHPHQAKPARDTGRDGELDPSVCAVTGRGVVTNYAGSWCLLGSGRQAYDASHAVLQKALRLAEFAHGELKHSKHTMRCCAVVRSRRRGRTRVQGLTLNSGFCSYYYTAHPHGFSRTQAHELPNKRSTAVVYGVILVAGVAVYLAVLYLAQTSTGNHYYARRSAF